MEKQMPSFNAETLNPSLLYEASSEWDWEPSEYSRESASARSLFRSYNANIDYDHFHEDVVFPS